MVRSSGEGFPVPASMVLSALAAGTALLAGEAARDKAAVARLRSAVTERAVSLLKMPVPALRQTAEVLEKNDPAPDFNGFVSLASERRALVVSVVTALDAATLEHELAAADAQLRSFDVAAVRRLGVPLDPTGLVLPLVVYGGPCLEPLGERGPTAHLHIEDLVTIVRDLDQDELDRDVLLQFLEELVLLPGVEHFFPFDAEDVWRHWRRFRVLNPTGKLGVALAVDPRSDDAAWAREAAWAAAESALCALRLAPSWLWSSARLDERGYATLFGADKSVLFVLTDPRLVVRTALDNALSQLGIDATFAYAIADGIFLTFANRPETARLLIRCATRPVLVNIDFAAERQPGVEDQHVAVSVRTARGPLPMIDLLLGPDWLEYLADSPQDAHHVIGEVLLAGLDALNGDTSTDTIHREQHPFVDAWCSAPPVAMLHVQRTTRDHRPQRAFMLPRTFASRARAERMVAQAVTRASIRPNTLVDSQARQFVRARLLPLIEDTLRSLLASWSREAVGAVAEQVNDAYGERARASTAIQQALAAPWAATWQQLSRSAAEEPQPTRPLDLLLEHVLISPLSGTVVPDRFDIAEAADLVAIALETDLALDSARRQLHGLAIMIADDGRVAVLPGPASKLRADTEPPAAVVADLDLPSYLRADRANRLRVRTDEDLEGELRPVRLDGRSSRRPTDFAALAKLPNIPRSLLDADALLLAVAVGQRLSGGWPSRGRLG